MFFLSPFQQISIARIAYRVQNNRVDQLLYRRLVVREVDLAGLLLANMARLHTADRDILDQLVTERIGIGGEIAERGSGVGANNDTVLETRGIDDIDAGKDRAHGLSQRL